jgi:hypothetical protein
LRKFNIGDKTGVFNGNAMIIGLPNGGENKTVKNEILTHLRKGNRVVIFDFQGQYEDLKKISSIDKFIISSTEEVCLFDFNLMGNLDIEKEADMYRHTYISFCVNKTKSLLNLFERTLDEREIKFIYDTVTNLLKMNGITESTYLKKEVNPNLLDFLTLLKKSNEKLYNEISHLKNSFASRKTTLELTENLNLISFECDHLRKHEKDLLLHSLLLMSTSYTQTLPPYSTILIPDLSPFLSSTHLLESLAITIKAAKKFNSTYYMFHRSLHDLINRNGESILANCQRYIFFKQSILESEMLKYYFDFNDEEVFRLNNLQKDRSIEFGL